MYIPREQKNPQRRNKTKHQSRNSCMKTKSQAWPERKCLLIWSDKPRTPATSQRDTVFKRDGVRKRRYGKKITDWDPQP